MLTVLAIIAAVILLIVTFKYSLILLALFLTAGLFKGWIMLNFPFFRVVDYTVLCAVLVLIAMAYSFIKSGGRLRDIISVPLVIYLLLAIVLLLGVTYTSAPRYGLQKSSRFATFGLVAFLAPVVLAHSLKKAKRLIWILLVIGILLSIFTITEPYTPVLRQSTETRGAFLESGPLGTAVTIGTASVIAFVFAIMAHTSKRLRIASVAGIALMMVGIIITGSRGPFIGLGLTWLAAIFVCHRGVSKAWVPVIVTAILIATVVSFTKLPETVTTRITGMLKSTHVAKEATYARTERFVWAASRSGERLILGHGTGAFAVDRGGPDEREYPHNIILEILYEGGLVGVVIESLFLWLIFRRWRQATQFVYLYELDLGIFQMVHIAGLLFLFSFTQAMKSGDIDGNRLMFFCAGLVMAVFSTVRRTVEEMSLENELTVEGQQYSEGFEFAALR